LKQVKQRQTKNLAADTVFKFDPLHSIGHIFRKIARHWQAHSQKPSHGQSLVRKKLEANEGSSNHIKPFQGDIVNRFLKNALFNGMPVVTAARARNLPVAGIPGSRTTRETTGRRPLAGRR